LGRPSRGSERLAHTHIYGGAKVEIAHVRLFLRRVRAQVWINLQCAPKVRANIVHFSPEAEVGFGLILNERGAELAKAVDLNLGEAIIGLTPA
jgi:hypothetical protein